MALDTRFAWIADDSVPRSEAEWDQEILRTDRFVAVPSVGALVAGWTLVVPRRPMLNLALTDAGERRELAAIGNRIASALMRPGLDIFCFEHGSRRSGSLTGCGVDQAHLHIVPLPFDLIEAVMRRDDGTVTWHETTSESPLDALPTEREYILLWRMTDLQAMIGTVWRPVSQWVRRIIADELGVAAEWNYRTHPQTPNVRQTLAMLASLRTAPAR